MTDSDYAVHRDYNAVQDFVDAPVARGLGDRIAFTDPTRSLSYDALQSATCRFAHGLMRLGLRQESRVVLLMFDTVDYPIAFWGAIRAGIVPVPLNTLLTSEQYAYILEDSRAEAVVISTSLIKSIEPVIDRLTLLRLVIVAGAGPGAECCCGRFPTHRFDDVLGDGAPAPWTAQTLSDEVAFWLYSSGSTGDPKGVKHVHTSLIATARLYGEGVLGITAEDVVFSAAKLFFAYGLGNSMSFPMAVGASAVLLPDRPTPDAVLEVMRRHRPTIFFGSPALYAGLLAHHDIGGGAGSDRLRLCVSAAEALPPHIGERWRQVVGVDILDGIGSTEMLHIFLSNRQNEIRWGTSGKPVPGYDAKIVGEDGSELGDGEIGELVVRGPSSAEGYWNQRAKTRRTFAGEWTYTGDKYLRDRDGYYQYCGRTDDMFKVSGVWVSPFEVEAVLMSHAAVLASAVIARKDHDDLVKPKAFVVLKVGCAADPQLFEELKAHVKQHAGVWKYPRWIEVREELPMTATGKVQRFKLREEDAVGDRPDA
ncbi:MAG TPA: benzoate-CoA ligase family protein [Xanthobacteraceae bacterium]|nr:benzoate-CoA ligase family protein [Xanthobacteraceae bacterium]